MKRSRIKAASLAAAPLAQVQCVLTSDINSSLYAIAVLRTAQDALKEAELVLKPEANEEFTQLIDAEPLKKEFSILDPSGVKIATVVRYSARPAWQYSEATIKLGEALKAAQAREQANGTATKIAGESDTIFSLRKS